MGGVGGVGVIGSRRCSQHPPPPFAHPIHTCACCPAQVFPKQLLLALLPPELDILCTHPMFGPDSGKGECVLLLLLLLHPLQTLHKQQIHPPHPLHTRTLNQPHAAQVPGMGSTSCMTRCVSGTTPSARRASTRCSASSGGRAAGVLRGRASMWRAGHEPGVVGGRAVSAHNACEQPLRPLAAASDCPPLSLVFVSHSTQDG
jgi:hypothetical protein